MTYKRKFIPISSLFSIVFSQPSVIDDIIKHLPEHYTTVLCRKGAIVYIQKFQNLLSDIVSLQSCSFDEVNEQDRKSLIDLIQHLRSGAEIIISVLRLLLEVPNHLFKPSQLQIYMNCYENMNKLTSKLFMALTNNPNSIFNDADLHALAYKLRT